MSDSVEGLWISPDTLLKLADYLDDGMLNAADKLNVEIPVPYERGWRGATATLRKLAELVQLRIDIKRFGNGYQD